MKSVKHLNRKEEIIDTAFKVWQLNCFTSTSLNDIAESLGMTKQAIYRYFKGKSGLISEMSSRITDHYRSNFRDFRRIAETESRDQIVREFIRNQIEFFRNHSEYLSFLISKIRLADEGRRNFIEVIAEQTGYLQKELDVKPSAVNYILNLIVFYIFIDSLKSTEELTGRIYTLVTEGFGTELLAKPSDPERLLRENRIPENDMTEENKVLQSISEVVMEEGPHNASLDKIAKRAGMTKSSLYFYFNNKEEMITETINRQTEAFTEYYFEKISAYEEVGDQLFAHFVLTASMTIERPKTVSMIHWFIRRGIGDSFRKPTEFEKYRVFFENAANYRYLNTHGITADQLLLLVNFCVTFEVNNQTNRDLEKESKYGLVHDLYDLFVHGLKALQENKK
ncbi:TetR/AcrR family transcriptional regulator [Spirochaeta isovalerica]|uniref:AcrR family transcriptional regulator n=1 Tax=Spirochaeta isovalerica TaxID=150 RepID=A0A841REL7_9SPIO|nr:TetR/AcrR family transcriptional regulator [Spirochaeta isovalerica]MBB6481058.1 AcrR family transcriptional regulator [Spirochaeta isovalerica]